MIILDTNVLSALTDVSQQGIPAAWLDRQPGRSVWTTSATVYELHFGILRLPIGRRRTVLTATLARIMAEILADRVLPLDAPAAQEAARIAAARRSAGVTIEIQDTYIAGIALAHRATIATRNVRDFADLDVPVINPWAV